MSVFFLREQDVELRIRRPRKESREITEKKKQSAKKKRSLRKTPEHLNSNPSLLKNNQGSTKCQSHQKTLEQLKHPRPEQAPSAPTDWILLAYRKCKWIKDAKSIREREEHLDVDWT